MASRPSPLVQTFGAPIFLGALLGACTSAGEMTTEPAKPEYEGIQTVLMDGDLVGFRLAMKGAASVQDVEVYGRCAAAQYALIRGAGFARHIRTQVGKRGDQWLGDAVYMISAALPPGLRTIDAEVTVRDCGARGIPTV